ncbi:hypothetical protein [Streptomyces cyaneofuscatus]|uniref:hypothetical protein n=1 Tax=Streptomyces cyaneofuscatus TaxID=66883 RepID=UPI003F54135C
MRKCHPTVGRVSVDYQGWLQPDIPDHRLEICTANDEPSADALRLLAGGQGSHRPAGQSPDRPGGQGSGGAWESPRESRPREGFPFIRLPK